MLRFASALLLLAAAAQARDFTFHNRLNYTIWVVSQGNAGLAPIDGGGWEMNSGATMTPTDQHGSGYSCTSANCNTNIDGICPDELQVRSNDQVVACKSACLAFNTDQYCCHGAYNTAATCQSSTWPVNYPKIFKDACPQAYSYAYDDVTSTFTCNNTNYDIVFGD